MIGGMVSAARPYTLNESFLFLGQIRGTDLFGRSKDTAISSFKRRGYHGWVFQRGASNIIDWVWWSCIFAST